jgi:DNA-binding MarR family transcriptional regulator
MAAPGARPQRLPRGVEEANVTGVVQALERTGLVRRVRGDPDQRLRVVWLTREGKRVLDKVFPPHVQRVADSLGVLSPRVNP